MVLQIGDKIPNFSLKNQAGELIESKNLIGEKNLVLFFYPKDETPGCIKEVCSFRDAYADFQEQGSEVVGISSDSVQSHKKFAENRRLTYNLLSDTKKEVRKAFGVPSNFLGLIAGRVTYVIDKQGIIRGIYDSLSDSQGHVETALKTLKSL
jgi:peroxiredoxin Q/BCP